MKLSDYCSIPASLPAKPIIITAKASNVGPSSIVLDLFHPYALSRGITPEIGAEMGIGVYNNKLHFSVHDIHGNFVSTVGRVLDNSEPKYDFSTVTKTQHLYNYHRARKFRAKAVVVVEGFVDCIKVHLAGYPCVALMGLAMSDKQAHYLTRWWEYVVMMLDGDAPGRKAQEEHCASLHKLGFKGIYWVSLPDKVQPDMLNPEQVKQALSTCKAKV